MRFVAGAALFWALTAMPAAASPPQLPDAEAAAAQILVLLRLPPPRLRPGIDYAGSYGDTGGRTARRRIAAALANNHGLTLTDDWPMPLLGVDCFVMAVPASRVLTDVAALLTTDPRVDWAQPVNRFASQSAKSAPPPRGDPLLPAQPAATAWHLADLHRIADGRGARGVRVAIIDSQVDTAHPDLAGQVRIAENFVAHRPAAPEQHGTAVAGIIAAHAGNGIGIAGIAPRSRLMALRACWQGPAATVCDSFSLAKAIYYAVDHHAEVINLSLGGPGDALLARLLDLGIRRGATIVAAVDPALPHGGFPASHPGVVAVSDMALATQLSFVAPGRGIPTTQVGGRFAMVDGSSYSAAHVSGLLALARGLQRGSALPPVLVAAPVGGSHIDSCATLRQSGGGGACPSLTSARR